MRRFILLCLPLFLGWSCSDEEPQVQDFSEDYRYFPLTTGFVRDYAVEETEYFLNEPTRESRYQVREEIGEAFTSLGGESAVELLRYRRNSATENWQLDSVWVIRYTPSQVVRVENNVPFIALRFPLRQQMTWDGNLLNTQRRDDYQLTELHVPKEVGQESYPRTLTVVQNADSSLVNKDVRQEIYAQDIGLVFRYSEVLLYCADPTDACFGQNVIERGRKITYTLFNAEQL